MRSVLAVPPGPYLPPRAPGPAWADRAPAWADREPARCQAGMAQRGRCRRSAANFRLVGLRSFPRRWRSSPRRPACSSRPRARTSRRPRKTVRKTEWACPRAQARQAFPACQPHSGCPGCRNGLTRRSTTAASRCQACSRPPRSPSWRGRSRRQWAPRSPSPRRSSPSGRNCPRHSPRASSRRASSKRASHPGHRPK